MEDNFFRPLMLVSFSAEPSTVFLSYKDRGSLAEKHFFKLMQIHFDLVLTQFCEHLPANVHGDIMVDTGTTVRDRSNANCIYVFTRRQV